MLIYIYETIDTYAYAYGLHDFQVYCGRCFLFCEYRRNVQSLDTINTKSRIISNQSAADGRSRSKYPIANTMPSQSNHTPLRFVLVVCLTIGLLGTGQSPVKASDISPYPPYPSNHIEYVLGKYKRLSDEDLEQATENIQSIVRQTSGQVQQLYAATSRRLLAIVGRAIRAGCSNANAQHLYSVELPDYVRHVNDAVDGAIVQIGLKVSTFLADVRQFYEDGQSDIYADDTTSIEAIEEQVSRHTEETKAGVTDALERVQREVQQQVDGAKRIVQVYIARTVQRVRSVLSSSVAQRVSVEIQTASEEVDRVEKLGVANALAAAEQFYVPFGRLGQFFDELEQED